jgi:hypothetical protein
MLRLAKPKAWKPIYKWSWSLQFSLFKCHNPFPSSRKIDGSFGGSASSPLRPLKPSRQPLVSNEMNSYHRAASEGKLEDHMNASFEHRDCQHLGICLKGRTENGMAGMRQL